MLGGAVWGERGLRQLETFLDCGLLWGLRGRHVIVAPFVLCSLGTLTDRTDGGAFLYLFSRFLFAAGLSCAADV